jgi:pimeloyl-ACP methyl ester carboxylesterase
MQCVQLGASGLTVSRMALGTMTFGEYSFSTFQANVDQAASDRMVGLALDAGVNLFDTAEGYGQGRSEEVLGAALRRANARERAVISTKVSTFAIGSDHEDRDLLRLSYRHVIGNRGRARRARRGRPSGPAVPRPTLADGLGAGASPPPVGITRHREGAPMTEPDTHTLDVPGATLRYDVRDADAESRVPALLMIGSPMEASGFTTLAGHFRDRTVVTYDPRGVGRSERSDGATGSTPDEHADDLHRLIAAIGAGPVDVFASSGGAVNALELVARHPEQVHTLVAHEPPCASVLPDREQALAAVMDIRETYERDGLGPAMAKFIVLTSLQGPIPSGFGDPAPNPADFGLPTEDDGNRDDPMLGPHIVNVSHYEPDFDALRSASTRIVVAAGVQSEGALTYRAAQAVADGLATELVVFPSHHAGFLGGEFGQTGEPDAFAAVLREVLGE